MTTYAELAQSMPTRELIRQSTTHKVTCECDRCMAIYEELAERNLAEKMYAHESYLDSLVSGNY